MKKIFSLLLITLMSPALAQQVEDYNVINVNEDGTMSITNPRIKVRGALLGVSTGSGPGLCTLKGYGKYVTGESQQTTQQPTVVLTDAGRIHQMPNEYFRMYNVICEVSRKSN